jgi:hypothetical protein
VRKKTRPHEKIVDAENGAPMCSLFFWMVLVNPGESWMLPQSYLGCGVMEICQDPNDPNDPNVHPVLH